MTELDEKLVTQLGGEERASWEVSKGLNDKEPEG